MNRFIKTAGIILCLLFFIGANAQHNLVVNPSFEEYTECPDVIINKCDIASAYPWYSPQDSDNLECIAGYVNACADYPTQPCDVPFNTGGGGLSYQLARTGDAYSAAFFYNGAGWELRNTIQQEMLDSLYPGKCYYVEFFVSLA